MTLDEALHYIHSVCWKGSVPGLERISALLDKMVRFSWPVRSIQAAAFAAAAAQEPVV